MELSKINILHITNNLEIGGVQKVIYQLCDIQRDKFSSVQVASTGGVYVEKLNNIGITHHQIHDLSTKNLFQVFKIVSSLKKIVKEKNINIIHCHHRMAVLYAKMINSKATIIYNNHTIYSNKPKQTHYILKNIKIIADGEQAKKNVTDYFKISEDNIATINNAVDHYDGHFSEIEYIKKEKDKGNFIVMNSARLHPQKGMNYYIDAAKILIERGYNISFFIVGDGPLKDDVIKQIQQLQLEKHVHLLGFRNDIKNTISQCDVLVLTSVYEGLPLTPMEAFSVKKAVIGTDIPGTREVIHDGYNGLLSETKNAVSIAVAIEKLYLDRQLLETLSINAYKSFLNEFSIEPFAKSYLDFYKSL